MSDDLLRLRKKVNCTRFYVQEHYSGINCDITDDVRADFNALLDRIEALQRLCGRAARYIADDVADYDHEPVLLAELREAEKGTK